MHTGGSFHVRGFMEYTKPYLTFEELADKVRDRGLGRSRETLLFSLQTVGYYRLSGYWHIFHKDDVFFEGATIEKVMRVYDFDRQFRLITLNALEHIEVYFRTQLAHKLSRDYGAFGYLDASAFPRLKGNQYGTQPAIPKTSEWDYSCRKQPDRMFTILVIMQYSTRIISPNSAWRTRFEDLLKRYPDIDIQSMGFPQDWARCPIWKLPE